MFHSIPIASLAKPAEGPLAQVIWTEKLQILLFAIAFPFSVRA
jgi:hypothetical protein